MNIKLAMILILSSIAVIFVAQNIAVVKVGFLAWNFSIPSSLLIIFTLLIGFMLGWFVHSYIAYRKSRDIYEYLS
jgi:uncharacterized integral membrane protein